MDNASFDPNASLHAYRNAFAPMIKIYEEGLTAMERLGRYQHAVAGDYIDWGLAQAKAMVGVATPTELMSKQVQITATLGEKLRNRAQELVTLAGEAQTGFTRALSDATVKAADISKEATDKVTNLGREATARAAETSKEMASKASDGGKRAG